MKKVILIILLISMLFIMVGCNDNTIVDETPEINKISSNKYAMIIMPDGSIIQGECSGYDRGLHGMVYVTINDIEYRAIEWRVVIWAK